MNAYFEKLMIRYLKHSSRRVEQIRKLARRLSPQDTLLLEYPVSSTPRWSAHPHRGLYDLLNRDREHYRVWLENFAQHIPILREISPDKQNIQPYEPCWNNGWMTALDGVVLHGFISAMRPQRFFEVGSGYSTKYAFHAKKQHAVDMKILSIDPHPRAEIDTICDEVVRQPLEDVDVNLFHRLERNDILYIDSSHRCFMNSDVTVVFLEIIPYLTDGVIVGVHDIFLPYDYSQKWADRYYSEQYLLAAYLLAGGTRLVPLFPTAFVSHDKDLVHSLDDLWRAPNLRGVETHGCSFWMRVHNPSTGAENA